MAEPTPDTSVDIEKAVEFLNERHGELQQEADMLIEIRELIKRGEPLGELYAQLSEDYERVNGQKFGSDALIAQIKLTIVENITKSYLQDRVTFTVEGAPHRALEIFMSTLKKDMPPIQLASGEIVTVDGFVSSEIWQDKSFRSSLDEAVAEQVRKDIGSLASAV